MKIKGIIVFLPCVITSLLFFTCSKAQMKYGKSDAESANLNGRVKTVAMEMIHIEGLKPEIWDTADIVLSKTDHYDERGNLHKTESGGSVSTYTLDKYGNRMKIKTVIRDTAQNNISLSEQIIQSLVPIQPNRIFYTKYERNASGEIERTNFDSLNSKNNKMVYTYSDDRKHITKKYYSNAGELISTTESYYDEDGRIVKESIDILSTEANDILKSSFIPKTITTDYFYYENGELKKIVIIEDNTDTIIAGQDTGKTVKSFNEFGDVIKFEEWDEQDALKDGKYLEYQYQYGSHDNWIEQTEIEKSTTAGGELAVPKTMKKRTIEYYE